MYQVLGQCQFGWCKQVKLPPLGLHSTQQHAVYALWCELAHWGKAGNCGPVHTQDFNPWGQGTVWLRAVLSSSTSNPASGWKSEEHSPLPAHLRQEGEWKCCLDTAVTSPGSLGPAVPALLSPARRVRFGRRCWRCEHLAGIVHGLCLSVPAALE